MPGRLVLNALAVAVWLVSAQPVEGLDSPGTPLPGQSAVAPGQALKPAPTGRAAQTAAGQPVRTEQVEARLVADTAAVAPGKPFRLGVLLTMEPGWHTYYKDSGEAGMPTSIKWQLPPGFTAGELEWEKPLRFNDSGIITYGYSGQTLIGATVTPPSSMEAVGPLDFKAKVSWLACKDICTPGDAALTLSLPVAAAGIGAGAANTELFAGLGFQGSLAAVPDASEGQAAPSEESRFDGSPSILDQKLDLSETAGESLGLAAYLALAFVGGFILNFMPCVLPVISIKVLSFMQQAGEDPRRVFRLGLAFAGGIVSSFMVLAGLVIALKQAGQQIGWGFQFQYPVFVLIMACVILVLSLSMFGLFYIHVTAGQSTMDKLAGKEGMVGTFFKGVLATILSTPCTAPALGTAIGFAFAQPDWTIALVFLTVSLGMAFPYLLLTARPQWMKYLPRPGTWMERFKEGMGFLLLATVIWLLWVLGKQVGVDAALSASAFLVVLASAVWIVGRFTDLTSGPQRRAVAYGSAVLVVSSGYFYFLKPYPELISADAADRVAAVDSAVKLTGNFKSNRAGEEELAWEPFSIEELDRQLKAGRTVLLDFTADWCLTCKVNEATVINTPAVIAKVQELNAVAMRADWTRRDARITELLARFGRSGVPLYVIFPGSRPTSPIVLPEVITQKLLLEKLDEAGSSIP